LGKIITANNPGRVLGKEIVRIFVGPKRKEFAVHKNLICSRAGFFDKAFNAGFKEGCSGELYLVEDYNSNAFENLVDYIYRQALPEWECDDHTKIVALYNLAEKLCMEELMNLIIDDMRKRHEKNHSWFGPTASMMIYLSTHSGNKLRKSVMFEIVADIVDASTTETVDFGLSYLNLFESFPEAGGDMLKAQCKYTHSLTVEYCDGIPHGAANNCDFHVHAKQKGCSGKPKAPPSLIQTYLQDWWL
jgi:hypothetical protein